MSLTAFRVVQGFYWLALGTWFGALVMLAIAAAVTFRTVREYKPVITLAPYNDPALADRSDAILAGGIVGNVLRGLAVVQVVCAAIAGGCLVLQCTVFADQLRGGPAGVANLVRVAFVVVPVVLLAVDQLWISPRIWALRSVMFDPAETATARSQARLAFDSLHKMDERVVSTAVWFLLAAVFVSAFVFEVKTPRSGPEVTDARGGVPPT